MIKMSGESLNITQRNIQQLKELFPEVLTDGEKIDFEMLKTVLGETVEDNNERYQFTWPGKKQTISATQQPSKATLRPVLEKSKNFENTENIYIEGDNFEVLKLLQKSYNGKIKMIYIDPPYNTGKDFVYKDNFKDGIQNYLEQTQQVDSQGNIVSTNSESNGRFHTDWLNMMYARLKLTKNLLTEDGVIFISIDDNENTNLKNICDEIYGENNFIGIITWEKKRKGSFLSKKIVSLTEYIYVYAKKYERANTIGGIADPSESQPLIKRTNSIKKLNIPCEAITTKLNDGIYKMGNYGDGTTSVKLLKDVEVRNGKFLGDFLELEGPFIWNQKNLDDQFSKGATFVINTLTFQVRTFKAIEENKFKGFPSIIRGKEIAATNEDAYEELIKIFGIEKIFDYSKPKNLLKELINSQSFFDKDIYVLDFFSGSASTAHALMELNSADGGNRKFIMVQLPELLEEKSESYSAGYRTICDIGEERIRRAGEKIKKNLYEIQQTAGLLEVEEVANPESLDIGFKVFKLDTSNISEWNVNFKDLEDKLDLFETPFIDGRSELDIVYEIMLKQGLELTYPINTFEVEGKIIYDIAYGNLFICLANGIDANVARAIIAKRDEYEIETSCVVFSDPGFINNDSEKLNCIELLKDAGYPEDNLLTI